MLKEILSWAVGAAVAGGLADAGTWWDRKHRRR